MHSCTMARRVRTQWPGRLFLAAGALLFVGSLRAFCGPRSGRGGKVSTSRGFFQPDLDDTSQDDRGRSEHGRSRGRTDSNRDSQNDWRDGRHSDYRQKGKRVESANQNTRPENHQRYGRADRHSHRGDSQGGRSSDWDSPSDRGQAREEEREERSRFLTPSALTPIIKNCETDVSLVKTIDKALQTINFNSINVAAAFSKLASLKGTSNVSLETRDCLQELTRQGARLAARRDFRARESATVLMAAASLHQRMPFVSDSLVPSILKWIPEQAEQMTPQGLANTIWAIGEFRLESEESRNAIRATVHACLPQLGRFSSMDLAATAWGLGAWGDPDEASELLDALAGFAADLVPTMDKESAVLHLPQIALGLTRLGFWHPELMDAIARRLSLSARRMELPSFNLAALNCAWMQPCSPLAHQLPERASRKSQGQASEETIFLSALQKQAKREGLSSEDIERSLEGPKLYWAAVEDAKSRAASSKEQTSKVKIEWGSMKGTIQAYNPAKGYGYIATEDFKPHPRKWQPGNVFFKMSHLPKKAREYELFQLQGIPVSFNLEDSGDGRKSVKDWSLKLLKFLP